MQTRAVATLILAVVLAGVSVALAHAWLTDAARAPSATPAPIAAGAQTVPLVVAARGLRYGEKLGAADLKLVAWPRAAVPSGAFHSLDRFASPPGEVEPVVLRTIEANEPVLTGKITGFGAPGRLAATIAPGMRAATVSMSGAPDMAALIGPGDRVDVLLAREILREGGERELRSDVLLRDVRVLGLDQSAGGPTPGPARPRPVTLEVTLEEAQKLAVGQKIGTLSLALRGVGPRDSAASQPVSSRDLPAGLDRDTLRPAGWTAEKKTVPTVTPAPRDGRAEALSGFGQASVRVYRGLEASQYGVRSENPDGAIGMIDAAKAAARAEPAGEGRPR